MRSTTDSAKKKKSRQNNSDDRNTDTFPVSNQADSPRLHVEDQEIDLGSSTLSDYGAWIDKEDGWIRYASGSFETSESPRKFSPTDSSKLSKADGDSLSAFWAWRPAWLGTEKQSSSAQAPDKSASNDNAKDKRKRRMTIDTGMQPFVGNPSAISSAVRTQAVNTPNSAALDRIERGSSYAKDRVLYDSNSVLSPRNSALKSKKKPSTQSSAQMRKSFYGPADYDDVTVYANGFDDSRGSSQSTLYPEYETNRDAKTLVAIDDELQYQQPTQRYKPWFLWTASAVQVIMLIVSMAINLEQTGSLIQTNPFNFMIGPGPFALIEIGARYVPCMKSPSVLTGKQIECPPGAEPQDGSDGGTCTVQDICNLPPDATPDQWYRFISAIFVHGGILHLLFNLAFQLGAAVQLEREFGGHRLGIVYMLSGIFGFIFGGTFSNQLQPSVGASGALFGIVGCIVLDLVQNWKIVLNPKKELFKLVAIIIVSFAIGFLPGIDNFSHIGGFFMGILSGLVFLPTTYFGKWDKRGKRTMSIVGLILTILAFVGILTAFYSSNPEDLCSWCKFIGCLPIGGLCDIGLEANTQ